MQIKDQTPLIKTLDTLPIGQTAIIDAIAPSQLSSKLVQMGFLPNKKITILRKTLFGNPLYVQLGEQFMAMRQEEAALIIIRL